MPVRVVTAILGHGMLNAYFRNKFCCSAASLQVVTRHSCACLRKLEESRTKQAALSASLASAAQSAEASKAAAAERQKRFNLLNSQFKKREAGLQERLTEQQNEGVSSRIELQQVISKLAAKEQV